MRIYMLRKLLVIGSAYNIASVIGDITNCHDNLYELAEAIVKEHGLVLQFKGERYFVTEYLSDDDDDDDLESE